MNESWGARRRDWVHRYPCVAITAAAVVGIAADRYAFDSFQSSVVFWATLTAVGFTTPRVLKAFGMQASPWIGLLTTAIAVTSAFALWHAWDEQSYRSATLKPPAARDQEPVVVRGRVSRTVTVRPNPLQRSTRSEAPWQSQLEIELDSIREGSSFRSVSGNVLTFIDGDQSHLNPGDRLQVYGWLHGLAAPTNPGGADLRDYYRRKRLHGRIETKNAGSITVLEQSSASVGGWVSKLAKSGRESLLRHTDERTGPLAIALVIGQREFVDAPTRDALLATGTAHLLSVSGLHLAIIVFVAGWLVSALGLPATARFAVIVGISVLYVLVTGNRPPVFRAAILVSVLLFATSLRRTSQPFNALGAAALVLISAAGNQGKNDLTDQYPMLPAKWEELPAPSDERCIEITGERPQRKQKLKSPASLVYAISGVDSLGQPLKNTRKYAKTRIGAFADHVAVDSLITNKEDTVTGSSVATIVVSSIASMIWANRPDLNAYEVMDLIYLSGDKLNYSADFLLLNSGLDKQARRASMCKALAEACQGGFCALPGNCNWPQNHPNFLTSSIFTDPITQHYQLGELQACRAGDPECVLSETESGPISPWILPQPDPIPCPNCLYPMSDSSLVIETSASYLGIITQADLIIDNTIYRIPNFNLGDRIMIEDFAPDPLINEAYLSVLIDGEHRMTIPLLVSQ